MKRFRERHGRAVLRGGLAATFVFAGVMHFVATDAFAAVMPPYLPWHRELVLVSGAFEIAGGLGVLLPDPVRRWAGWGLIALLIAVLPANVEVCRRGVTLAGVYYPPVWGWVRLPVQALFIAWAWYAAVAARRAG